MNNTLFLRELNARPIAFYPLYAKIAGGVTAGVLLSQLMYWFANAKQDKIYKTNAEILEETTLSEAELKTAKNKVKNLGFIHISLEGLPARTYYQIDWGKYQDVMINFANLMSENSQTSQAKTSEPVRRIPPNLMSENSQTYNRNNLLQAETTTETTTKNSVSACEKNQTSQEQKTKTHTPKTESKKFTKPNLEDLEAYKQEKNLRLDCEEFYDYYESKGWLVGKTPMKDWRSAMRNWARNEDKFNSPPPTITQASHNNLYSEYELRGQA